MHENKIAENLVRLRLAKGVSQEKVAQRLSVSNKTISKWENGASAPDLSMLVELSKYYGVTTDELLGLCEEKKQSAEKGVSAIFDGLDRRELALQAFETMKAFAPAVCETISKNNCDIYYKEDCLPAVSRYSRYSISFNDYYAFFTSSENANMAVMMLPNESDFSWMSDNGYKKEITRIFKFLSDEDTLSVLYFVHSTACSESFTADYISKNTGVEEKRVVEILNEFGSVSSSCNYTTAHLAEGEVRVYWCDGDGLILSLISLAFERMCGRRSYAYNIRKGCKMIGGK